MSPIKQILVVVDPTGGDRQASVDKSMILAQCFHASVELLICDIPPDTGNSLLCPSDELPIVPIPIPLSVTGVLWRRSETLVRR